MSGNQGWVAFALLCTSKDKTWVERKISSWVKGWNFLTSLRCARSISCFLELLLFVFRFPYHTMPLVSPFPLPCVTIIFGTPMYMFLLEPPSFSGHFRAQRASLARSLCLSLTFGAFDLIDFFVYVTAWSWYAQRPCVLRGATTQTKAFGSAP